MSFLKQILKPFVEFDEDIQKKEETNVNINTSNQSSKKVIEDSTIFQQATHPLINEVKSATPPVERIPTYAPTGALAKPLAEHVLYFEQLIEHANKTNPTFQGADYKEFIDNKLDIDDIADEALKYTTAYNVLRTSGLTKAKLLQTGQEYLNLIGRDLNNFQGAQALKYRRDVGPKEDLIQKKAEELLVIQQQINKLKSELNTLSQEVNLASEKMNTVRNSFLLAGEMKQNEIEGELKKIDKYFD